MDNEDYKASFNAYVEEACKVYAERALWATDDISKLMGLRYAAGELRGLQALVNSEDEEANVAHPLGG